MNQSWNEPMNMTACGWPERNWLWIWHQPGFRYPDIILRPIWIFICTCGNILNLVLLRNNHTFQAVFLRSLAGFDSGYMWTWFPLYIRDRVGADRISGAPEWATLTVFEYLGNVCAQCSDWILVAFSLTRLMCILDPFGTQPLFTPNRMRNLVFLLLFLAALANVYGLFEYGLQDSPKTKPWMSRWRQVHEIASIMIPFLTFILIFLINLILAWILIKSHLMRVSSAGEKIGINDSRRYSLQVRKNKSEIKIQASGKDKRSSATMRLLTAAVGLYLVSRIPYLIWQIILQLERHCIYHLDDHQSVIFLPFYYQFLYANYSVNFIVYCGVSRLYAKKVFWIITHCRNPPEMVADISKLTALCTLSRNNEIEAYVTKEVKKQMKKDLKKQMRETG